MSACEDKYSIRVRIEHLPDGVWLATSEDFPGLVVEAPTRDEVIAEVPIVAQKLIESYCERGDPLPPELVARATDTLPEVSEVEIAVAL
jgi:predicted RNase H-like HicB family nuclease